MKKDIENRPDVSKWVFYVSALVLVQSAIFGFGLYSGAARNSAFHFVNGAMKFFITSLAEIADINFSKEPIHFLQPARYKGSGVTINERKNDQKLVLIAGFFGNGNEIRLIRRDGTPVAQWPVRFSEHFPDPSHMKSPPQTDFNIDIHGALINPDGSIVFNYEYGGTVKLSRCRDVVWTLAHPTHHSVESAEGGGYWIAGRRYRYEKDQNDFPPFTRQGTTSYYEEDLILRVSEDGTIEEQVSVPRILYDSGLEPLMTATGYSFRRGGYWERELVHLNKIGELSGSIAGSFPDFEKGDLVLSLRGYNLVLVVDPDDWRVKWHETGPWRRQHDPEFNADGTISIFNNNSYRIELDSRDRSDPSTPRVSNIMKVSPSTGRVSVVYGGQKDQAFLSVIRGKHQPTAEGGFLITEFEAGRVFEIDARGKTVWEYINRYDDSRVLEMTEARLYQNSYFTVRDWTCPDRSAGS